MNDEVSFDSNSEKSFDESELSEDSGDSDAPRQGGLIGVQEHNAEDKNELRSKNSSKIGGTIRISSSHSKRSQKSSGALASKYTRARR